MYSVAVLSLPPDTPTMQSYLLSLFPMKDFAKTSSSASLFLSNSFRYQEHLLQYPALSKDMIGFLLSFMQSLHL
jgi:hypothetical protein